MTGFYDRDGEPTMLLRFVERTEPHPDGGSVGIRVRVLQQLWRVPCMFTDGFPGIKEEWRDVPLEVQQ